MNPEKQYFLIKLMNRLLKKGYSLMDVVNLITYVYPIEMKKMKMMLEKGALLSSVFKKLKFKRFVYETIQIGEESNKIHEMLSLIEKQFDFYLKLKKQLSKVLLYPSLLIVFALICFELIRKNLYPVISNLLSDFSVFQNQILILIAFNLLKWIVSIIIILFLIVHYFKNLSNFFPFMKIYRTLMFSKRLEVLLLSGHSLEESLIILKKSLEDKIYQLNYFQFSLIEEKKLSIFSPFSTSYIEYFKIGIKSNDLISSLQDYHFIYDEILFDHLTKITYYVQFGLFTILSVNIFLIYYLVMIPMLQISQQI